MNSTPIGAPEGTDTGRVTAIAVNPTATNDIWLGGADGGLWHSKDSGQ